MGGFTVRDDCVECGMTHEKCIESIAQTGVDVFIMQKTSEFLPAEYSAVLKRIVLEWRTHALPKCNPLSID